MIRLATALADQENPGMHRSIAVQQVENRHGVGRAGIPCSFAGHSGQTGGGGGGGGGGGPSRANTFMAHWLGTVWLRRGEDFHRGGIFPIGLVDQHLFCAFSMIRLCGTGVLRFVRAIPAGIGIIGVMGNNFYRPGRSRSW